MRVDLSAVEDGAVFDADLCIIGAGAAGITIARDLVGSRLRICLLEGGGFVASRESQDLYAGRMLNSYTDRPGHLEYLTYSRLRYFGGSTNHWAGWCRPLDASDFERRSWVPNSGWPIRRETLEPWYRRAAETCEIPAFAVDPPLPDAGPRAPIARDMIATQASATAERFVAIWPSRQVLGKKRERASIGSPTGPARGQLRRRSTAPRAPGLRTPAGSPALRPSHSCRISGARR